jgi:hypothetical protein
MPTGWLTGKPRSDDDPGESNRDAERERQRDSWAAPHPGRGGGHDRPRHPCAEGLTEHVTELKSRGCPAFLARRGAIEGDHRQRCVGDADPRAGHRPGDDPQRGRHRRQKRDAHHAKANGDQALAGPDQAPRTVPGDAAGLHPRSGRPREGRRRERKSGQRRRGMADGHDRVRDIRVASEEAARQQRPAEDRGGQPGPCGQVPRGCQTAQRDSEKGSASDTASDGHSRGAGAERRQRHAGAGDHAQHGQIRHWGRSRTCGWRNVPQGQHNKHPSRDHQRQQAQEHPPPADCRGHQGSDDWPDQARHDPCGGKDGEHARPALLGITPGDRHVGHRGYDSGAKALHRTARHENRHVRRGPTDDQAKGEEGKTGEHRPPERHPVGQRPGQRDANQACQQERAEHPPVETKISQVAADHRQDGSDGERLERDEGNREHKADRQRAARRRPYPARWYPARQAGRRRWGSGCICAHQDEGKTSTASACPFTGLPNTYVLCSISTRGHAESRSRCNQATRSDGANCAICSW